MPSLCADYTRDKDNTLVCQPKKYIEGLVESYHFMLMQNPLKDMRTPLDRNDHPDLDDTELLNDESILLKNPYSRFRLISSYADQFNSWCSPMLRCLFTCIFHNL